MKRLTAILLAALLLIACVLPAAADGELFFVSVGDTLPLALQIAQIPYYVDGVLYAPHTAFAAAKLGITPSYNAEAQILTLFDRNRRLVFDLKADTVTDGNGKSYPEAAGKAALRGGIVYIPAVFSARFFEKKVTLLTSKSGYTVLRFTVGNEVYDDALFLVRAENLMQYALQQYRTKLNTPTHTEETAPAQQTQPSASQSAEEKKPAAPEKPDTDVTAYLAVTGIAATDNALKALKQYGVSATFYFTADEIRAEPNTVRAVAAAGYPIGVTADTAAENVSAALDEAEAGLRRVLWRKSLSALLTQTQSQSVQGYAVQLRSAARTATYTAAQTSGSYLLICGENLPNVLAVLTAAEVHIRPLRETTVLK